MACENKRISGKRQAASNSVNRSESSSSMCVLYKSVVAVEKRCCCVLDVIKMLRTTPLIVRSSSVVVLPSRNERTRSTINKKNKTSFALSSFKETHTHRERERKNEEEEEEEQRERLEKKRALRTLSRAVKFLSSLFVSASLLKKGVDFLVKTLNFFFLSL